MFAGLTGGIGCGKSTALSYFEKLGWHTLDADRICHEIYETGDRHLVEELTSRWGEAILHNEMIARKKIAEIVFSDRNEMEWLNRLLHPLIMRKADEKVAASDSKYVIFDVPLLFETGLKERFDCTISVWTDTKQQLERLKQRGLNEKEIEARLAMQMPPAEKLEKADYGLINTGDKNFLLEQCIELDKQIRKKEHGKKKKRY